MVEQRAKFQGITAKLGPLDVDDIVGTGLTGGDTREGMGVIGKNFARSVERKSKSQNGGGLATSHRCACTSVQIGIARLYFRFEVVVGGTHLEFNFAASLETSMCMSTATLESTVREGLMHLVVFG